MYKLTLTERGPSYVFFRGLDSPDRARVRNMPIGPGGLGRDKPNRSPAEEFLRAIDSPVLRLPSGDR